MKYYYYYYYEHCTDFIIALRVFLCTIYLLVLNVISDYVFIVM